MVAFLLASLAPSRGLAAGADEELRRSLARVRDVQSMLDREEPRAGRSVWRYPSRDVDKVTHDLGTDRVAIAWYAEEPGFAKLENSSFPDHTQRATFMRQCGDLIEAWADTQDFREHSFSVAAEHWGNVLFYTDIWELDRTADEARARVDVLLHKIRDHAAAHRIECSMQAAKPTQPFDVLSAFANLPANHIGQSVLNRWRKALVSKYGDLSQALRGRNGIEARAAWEAALKAEATFGEFVTANSRSIAPLPDELASEFKLARRILARLASSNPQ